MKSPSSRPPQVVEMRLGSRFTPGVIALLATYAVTYVLSLPEPLAQIYSRYLLLRPAEALWPRPYQLLVAPLLETSFFSLLFLGILLWSIGSAVEQRVGTRRFVTWSLSVGLAAAIGATLFGLLLGLRWPLLALSPVVFDGQHLFMALLLFFAHFYGRLPVRMWGIGEPVSGRGLSYFFIGIGLAADALREQWVALAGQLVALGVAWAILHEPWNGFRQRLRKIVRKAKPARRGPFEVLDGGRMGKKSEPRWVN